MFGMIDIHQHAVYGMDDGAKDYNMTLHMLENAEKQNIRVIIATPHSHPGRQEFRYHEFINKMNGLNRYAVDQGWRIRLFPGTEIFYSSKALEMLDENRLPTLAMSKAVLVEFFPSVDYDGLYQGLRTLANGGYTPVLAHVERYECLNNHMPRIEELKSQVGVRLQMNCNTVLQPFSSIRAPFFRKLLDKGFIDFVASDAHNESSRPIRMQECFTLLEKRYGTKQARCLTCENQVALIPMLQTYVGSRG